MSENGPPHKSLRDSNSIDSTMSFISGASMTRSLERRSSSTASSSSSNGNQVEMSQRDITDVITKQAQAIQQAAARLHQHQYNDQPIMAKKSNAISQSAQNSITSPSGMVQLNLVNENGIVTPIEINASVAAAAALVAAQKHQQTKIDSEPSTNTMASSMSSTSAVSSFVNGSKEAPTGHKPLKLSQPSSNGTTSINVSYIQLI